MLPLQRNKYLIITIIGSHAGEDISTIFSRKQKEMQDMGLSYWLIKSFKAKTDMVQALCAQAKKEGQSVNCLFIESSQKNGARPTTHSSTVQYISKNNKDWNAVSDGIKITGKIDRNSTALVFDHIHVMNQPLSFDLWGYSEFGTGTPIKLQLGASTICCEQVFSEGMQSRFRNVVAVGRLHAPYAVWVK